MKSFDVWKEAQKERTYTLDGLESGGAYIRNNIFVSKQKGLYPGGPIMTGRTGLLL